MLNTLKTGLAVVVVLLGGMAAQAQYQIDNNLQVGGSQINADQVYSNSMVKPQQYQNNLVTGNVVGGRQFRGDVGYRAPGEFQDRLGSDTLYQFNARSAGSGYRGPVGVTDMQSYFRDSHAPSLGQIRAGGPSTGMMQANPAFSGPNSLTGSQGFDPGRMTPQATSVDLGSRPSRVGLMRRADGELLEVTASPLTGLSTHSVGVPAGGNAASSGNTPVNTLLHSSTLGSQMGTGEIGTTTASNPKMMSATPAYPQAAASMTPDGVRPRTQLMPQSILGPTATIEQRMSQIDAQLLGIRPSMELKPGEDAFMAYQQDQTNRARAAAGLPPVTSERDPRNQLVPTPAEVQPRPGANELVPRVPAWSSTLGQPAGPATADSLAASLQALAEGPAAEGSPAQTSSLLANPAPASTATEAPSADLLAQLKQQEQQELEARRRARGLEQPKPADAQATPPTDQAAPPTQAAPQTPAADFSAMAYTLDERTERQIQSADSDLQRGRYLDAERKYRNALLSNPSLMRARAGLLHSQLAAGMIRAAVVNLRLLAGEHPTAISYRHDARLLPSADRLEWVRTQIEQTVAEYGNNEATLLLAYLAYQKGDQATVRAALDEAQRRIPNDPIVPLLRRSWTGG